MVRATGVDNTDNCVVAWNLRVYTGGISRRIQGVRLGDGRLNFESNGFVPDGIERAHEQHIGV